MGSQSDAVDIITETYLAFQELHISSIIPTTFSQTFCKIRNISESPAKWTIRSFAECATICFIFQPTGPPQKWVMGMAHAQAKEIPLSRCGFLPTHRGRSKEDPQVARKWCYTRLMYSHE